MENRGSTPILMKMVRFHARNIHTNFDANPCSGSREEDGNDDDDNNNNNNNNNDDDDDGHRVIARVTLTH